VARAAPLLEEAERLDGLRRRRRGKCGTIETIAKHDLTM
jgi:hypothetical protein